MWDHFLLSIKQEPHKTGTQESTPQRKEPALSAVQSSRETAEKLKNYGLVATYNDASVLQVWAIDIEGSR